MDTKARCLAALVVAIAAFGTVAAHASDPPSDVLMHKISFTDLDLTRPAGARALYKRIQGAAEEVCAPFNGRQLIEMMNRKACVASAVERAVKQVNEPLLTTYHRSRAPKSGLAPSLAAKR